MNTGCYRVVSNCVPMLQLDIAQSATPFCINGAIDLNAGTEALLPSSDL